MQVRGCELPTSTTQTLHEPNDRKRRVITKSRDSYSNFTAGFKYTLDFHHSKTLPFTVVIVTGTRQHLHSNLH